MDLTSMRNLLQSTLGEVEENQPGPSVDRKGKGKIPAGRDDDTHYFDSYAENGMSDQGGEC